MYRFMIPSPLFRVGAILVHIDWTEFYFFSAVPHW